MQITLNNRQETIPGDVVTISDILKFKNYTFRMMVVKINGQLVKKNSYAEAEVREGDDVQILHMISGG
jgi:thiamine biosynthesis protein ThiS